MHSEFIMFYMFLGRNLDYNMQEKDGVVDKVILAILPTNHRALSLST
jgi:hypothetical protein